MEKKKEWIMQQKQEFMLQNLLLKRWFKKLLKATGDLIRSKIADKITSVGKSKNKEKKMKQMKEKGFTFHQTKRQQIFGDLRLF